ncbi:hypothetical protein BCON_0153g00080 [Botryotinia convoluta]|uniref:Uncharacterized protein n=1 Tax=Botryotinia convoluta TaxID=54673 RepID=A0A4Z1HXD6_9HELO|nr:hypothetical protein BCON_0153g00080 [Botryotinia convoluta]
MGAPNTRGSAANVRPSAAIFAEIARQKQVAANAAKAAQALAAQPFDLSTLPSHPAIVVLGVNEIGIRINKDTNMKTLLEYEPHVKNMAIEIHIPPPHMEAREKVAGRLESMKKFYDAINKFKWIHLDANVFLDTYNFPQMKLAAGLWGLNRKSWKLTFEVHGFEGDYVKVTDGSEFGRRLSGVYKKEFLNQAKEPKEPKKPKE